MRISRDEILQDDIIRVLRIYFNDKPCKEQATGFQRQCAKDVINLVDQDHEVQLSEQQKRINGLEASRKNGQNIIELQQKRIKELTSKVAECERHIEDIKGSEDIRINELEKEIEQLKSTRGYKKVWKNGMTSIDQWDEKLNK